MISKYKNVHLFSTQTFFWYGIQIRRMFGKVHKERKLNELQKQ